MAMIRPFELLEVNLAFVLLPTSSGEYRKASPCEFMFMGDRGEYHTFKHVETRNYYWVHRKTGKGLIPMGRDFMRGEFDSPTP